MDRLQPRSHPCERSRGWISLSLDGELSEFERAFVTSHLDRCLECASFAADVAATTDLLREAPLEPVPHIVVLATRRRNVGALTMRVGAAAAVLVGVLGLAGTLTSSSEPRLPNALVTHGTTDEMNDRLIRIAQRRAITPLPPPRPHPILMPE